MYFTRGNAKLGRDVVIVNRPVGLSCPLDCAFHPNGDGPWARYCYAARTEDMRPKTRDIACHNMEGDADQLANMLLHAAWEKRLVRVHSGGDFYDQRTGDLDLPYIAAWVRALKFCREHGHIPQILAFTHCMDGRLVEAFRPFADRFRLFASVHDEADIDRARAVGFTQFALAMPEDWRDWNGQWLGQRRLERHGVKWLVCLEQTRWKADCEECRFCWESTKGNVAFLEHSAMWRRRELPQRKEVAHG